MASDYFGFEKYVFEAPYSTDGFLDSPFEMSPLRACLILWISESISCFLAVLFSSYLNYKIVDLNSSIIFLYSSEFFIW